MSSCNVFLLTVTSVIMQKNGAGLHTASSCYWDNTTDGKLSQRQSQCMHSLWCLGLSLPYGDHPRQFIMWF